MKNIKTNILAILMTFAAMPAWGMDSLTDEQIEPLNIKTHGPEVRTIFSRAFPDKGIPEILDADKNPKGSVLIANGSVKGFMVTNDERPSFFKRWMFGILTAKAHDTRTIEWLAVDPLAQNKNYGSKLWNNMELESRQKGIKQVILVPTEKATRFYLKHDLRCIDSVDAPCVMMKKNLTDTVRMASREQAKQTDDDPLHGIFSA